MPVADRVKESIDKLNEGDPINALIQVCIAIDATSKKEYPGQKPGQRFKAFLKKNQPFITRLSTGKLEIGGSIIFTTKGRVKSLEEVLYKLVRCCLLHEGDLSEEVEITKNNVLGMTATGKVLVSENLIIAMVGAVVGSPVNIKEKIPDGYTIGLSGTDLRIDINSLWGKREYIHELVREYNK